MTYTREQLEALAVVARRHDLIVLSDEIYSELTYEGAHVSMGEVLPERTIVLNGVSKSHAMTGWRIGIAAGPADLIEQVGKVSEFSITCATANAQYAALEAFANGR
ncbi:aromatic amino acid aminotransferase, partial [Bifidobacterium aemilianum]